MSAETTGRTFPLAEARRIAEHIRATLASLCEQIDIAGSVRRGRPNCGDIDLVLLLKEGQRDALEKRVRQSANTRVLKSGTQIMAFVLHNGMQVDLYFATPATSDFFSTTPTNYGMRLLAMTGSKEHNVKLAKLAKSNGVHFHPYKGLMRGGEYVTVDYHHREAPGGEYVNRREEYEGGEVFASATEEEIFAALGLPFIPPAEREA